MPESTAIAIAEPYSARTIRYLELWSHGEWRLKVYGIACGRRGPAGAIVAAAKRLAAAILPEPARADDRYGVGFMGAHEGRGENLIFVDWWADENELRHHVFVAPHAQPLAFRDITATSRLGCVWDLAVIAFERRAWIDAVLLESDRPGIDHYLACHFDGVA